MLSVVFAYGMQLATQRIALATRDVELQEQRLARKLRSKQRKERASLAVCHADQKKVPECQAQENATCPEGVEK